MGGKLWVLKIWTVIDKVLWPEKNQIRPPIISPTKVCSSAQPKIVQFVGKSSISDILQSRVFANL